MKSFKNNNGPCNEQLNSCLNPLTTSVGLQNNNRSFLLPSYHLNEIHACFIWQLNNVDPYAFFIMCYTYAQFRHRFIGEQWGHYPGMSAGSNRWGSSRWKLQLRVNHRFHLGDLHCIVWLTVLTGKKVWFYLQWVDAAVATAKRLLNAVDTWFDALIQWLGCGHFFFSFRFRWECRGSLSWCSFRTIVVCVEH